MTETHFLLLKLTVIDFSCGQCNRNLLLLFSQTSPPPQITQVICV